MSKQPIAKPTQEILRAIARVAEEIGVNAYLVGGMVREIVAETPQLTTNPDITIIGEAEEFANELTARMPECRVESVSQFHTAKINLDGIPIDIASARTDTYDPWGSLPQITLVNNIENDLSRRDFTVNAMAIRLLDSGFGALIDPFNGTADCNNSTLRILHDDSFHEDPLRMLRGIRLAARYSYNFDPETAALLDRSLNDLSRMVAVSPQRVFNEFRLWFKSHENLSNLINKAQQTGILTALGINQDIPHNQLRHIDPNADEIQRFAAFAYSIPYDSLNGLVTQLAMSTHWRTIAQHVNTTRDAVQRCPDPEYTNAQLHRALMGTNNQVLKAIISIEQDPNVTTRLIDFQSHLRYVHNFLNGDDLIALGVKQGPMVGRLLEELQARRIEGKLRSAEDERRYVIRRLAED